jgi:hypothetical protein
MHEEMATDLEALRRESARDLPSIESIVQSASRRRHSWEERFMANFGLLTRRPWASTAIVGAVAAIAALVVPFSYERTTGHEVTLTLSGGRLDQDRVRGIALQFKKLLHSDGVAVQAEAANGALSFTLTSTAPNRAGVNVAAAASAFRAELGRLGYTAATKVTPVKERVMGSVYAYARDHVIEIDIDGKSASQIESEIRQGLADAGITNPQVSVTKDDAGHDLKVKVEATKTATAGADQPAVEVPELVLKRGGAPLEGNGFTVREEKRRTPDGTTLTLRVQKDGKSATIEIPHVDTMSDAAINTQVQSQLAGAGIDANVTVTNGRVQIEAKK